MTRKVLKRLIRQTQERYPNVDKNLIEKIWLDGYSIGIKSKSEYSHKRSHHTLVECEH